MTEMFEKVARALAAVAEQHSFLGAYAACGEEMTKAAIEAMREPTDEMVDAATEAIDDYYSSSKDAPFAGSVKAALRAAMLAVLEGKE